MFAAASKSGRAGGPTSDASFAYVPLLTETGSTNSRSTTVTDGAQTPNTVTRNNLVSTGWTSPYQTDGYWSNQFSGTTQYLSAAYNTAFNFASSTPLTIEFWFNTTGFSGAHTFVSNYNGTTTGWTVQYRADAGNVFRFSIGNTVILDSSAQTITAGVWYHVAVVRNSSNSVSIYLNGSSIATPVTNSGAFAATTQGPWVGGLPGVGQYYPGYISNLRIVNGSAVYTAAFTPPTTPLTAITNTALLTCQSNRFLDNSSNAFTLTVNGTPSVQSGYYPFAAPTASPGAALFNGTNQYLSSTASTVLQFGSNPYTIEGWVYQTSRAATQYLCGGQFSGTGIQLGVDTSGFIYVSVPGVSNLTSATIAITLNAWTHFACVRSSTSAGGFTYYINGVAAGTPTDANNYSGTTTSLNVATTNNNVSVSPITGYIGNFRVVKGTAVYTGAFTPPSGVLTQTGGTYPSTTNVNTSIPAANTSLLLALSDSNYVSATNGGTNNTFIDDSTNAFTITRNGTPTQGSRTPYWPNGQWSNYFAASGDYISVPDAANLELGASDFQMSAWIYLTAYPVNILGSYASTILSKGNFAGTRSYEFLIIGAPSTSISMVLTNAGATSTSINGSFSFALNTWYAVRATRVSNRVYLFVNGTLLNAGGTAYTDTVSNGTDTLKVGRANLDINYVYQFFGYVSNVSLAIGGTGYSTASYTPATTPTTAASDIKFLSCQSNRFKDNSSVPAVVTVAGTPTVQAFQPFSPAASYSAATYAGSGYFNGSTDYLTAASNAAFAFGSGDFTIEFWFYANVIPTTPKIAQLYDTRPASTNGAYILIYLDNDGAIKLWVNSANRIISSVISTGTWYHVALTRSGGSTKLFLNGTQTGSTYTDATVYLAGAPFIGASYSGGPSIDNFTNGYISNFRLVKGTAVYTTNFTPPTTPVTNITNTSLLLNMANAGIYDAAAQNDITTVASAQASTTQYKWSPTSMKFSGTTDALSIVSSTSFGLGTGDWTIEFWVYLNATTTQTLVSMLTTNTSVAPHIYYSNASGIRYFTNNADRITGGALSTGVWNYIAVTKASGTTKMYINGTQTGSNYTDANNYGTANPLAVGDYGVPLTGVSTLNGYVQDLRITKGVARTITTPTAAFPTR